jgi:tRNA1(Val) A37 N6-methylase TrmN6
MEHEYEVFELGGLAPDGSLVKLYISKEHRFGTDSLLLGEFSLGAVGKNDRVADLCSGCGIIPITLLKNEVMRIYAIEIQQEAADLIRQTIRENNLDLIEVVQGDLRDESVLAQIGRETIGLVTANPPYYPEKSGFERDSDSQKTARCEKDCTLKDVVKAAAYLLKFSGELKMCMTASRLAECIKIMQEYSIEPKEILFIGKSAGRGGNNVPSKQVIPARLFLISGKKGGKSGVTVGWK